MKSLQCKLGFVVVLAVTSLGAWSIQSPITNEEFDLDQDVTGGGFGLPNRSWGFVVYCDNNGWDEQGGDDGTTDEAGGWNATAHPPGGEDPAWWDAAVDGRVEIMTGGSMEEWTAIKFIAPPGGG